ncbi:Helix-loop-helix DNA-binding domain protein, partial [Opisthorchis viverrini]
MGEAREVHAEDGSLYRTVCRSRHSVDWHTPNRMNHKSGATKSIKPRRPRATMRERQRMAQVNQAFDGLRKVVPRGHMTEYQRLSKIATLRLAIQYIRAMNRILGRTVYVSMEPTLNVPLEESMWERTTEKPTDNKSNGRREQAGRAGGEVVTRTSSQSDCGDIHSAENKVLFLFGCSPQLGWLGPQTESPRRDIGLLPADDDGKRMRDGCYIPNSNRNCNQPSTTSQTEKEQYAVTEYRWENKGNQVGNYFLSERGWQSRDHQTARKTAYYGWHGDATEQEHFGNAVSDG